MTRRRSEVRVLHVVPVWPVRSMDRILDYESRDGLGSTPPPATIFKREDAMKEKLEKQLAELKQRQSKLLKEKAASPKEIMEKNLKIQTEIAKVQAELNKLSA